MRLKTKFKNNPDIQKTLADAWLNIRVDESKLFNPLDWPAEYDEEPEKYISWVLTQPEYFSFICKEILNVQLIPMQAIMLKEMWQRKFPMLIASRGYGKATTNSTPILTTVGWVNMGNITTNHKIYGRNGRIYNIKSIHPQGKKQICRLTFKDGRTIDCCEDHLWVILDTSGRERIVDTNKILEGVSIPNKIGNGGLTYKYRIPTNMPIEKKIRDLPLDPYIVGCLLGDGCTTTKTPKISSDDDFIVNEFRNRLVGFKIKKDKTNNNYTIVDINKKSYKFVSKLGNEYYKKSGNRLTKILSELQINVKCKEKFIPKIYKDCSINQRMELIRGLLDTDGSINKNGSIEFTNTSEQLVDDLIDVLRSLGINCKKGFNNRSGQTITLPQGTQSIRQSYYRVYINTSKPVFKLPRKLNRLKTKPTKAEQYTSIVKAERLDKYEDMQCITVDSPDNTYITKDYIVTHNSFILGVYALLRLILLPKRKIIIAGSAFRQSKVIFEYMESIWSNAPLLRDMVGTSGRNGPHHEPDMYRFYINEAVAAALPIGTGEKIRGQRANDLLCDEFASIPREIFENVLAGFAAVTSSPIDNVRVEAAIALAKEMGWWDEEDAEEQSHIKDNQIILSGTAYYDFNHFAEYWKDWHEIITSRGNIKKLQNFFARKAQQENKNQMDIPEDFNWRHYSIIRIPFELIPKGFMDASQVARSKATIHSGIYEMEFGAVFSKDSAGFFKRSLIESCTANPNNICSKDWPDYCPSSFEVMLTGHPNKRYVFGVDPASEVDNFSIIIIELNKEHRRVVYSWTTNREAHKQAVKDGLSSEEDFYSYCARKIRNLMVKFPCERIMMDSQGGGIAVMEGLHDRDKMRDGEVQIWPIINPDKEADTDNKPGLHILELVNFASADWTSEANHGLRKDMEDKIVLFPYFDAVTLANAAGVDKITSRKYDTLEDAVLEIESLKDELSTIVITQTPSGRDKWDTPEVKLPGGKKGRLRKDRYSALVMANMGARQFLRNPEVIPTLHIGGFAGLVKQEDGPMYTGNEWFNEWASDFYK